MNDFYFDQPVHSLSITESVEVALDNEPKTTSTSSDYKDPSLTTNKEHTSSNVDSSKSDSLHSNKTGLSDSTSTLKSGH